MRQLIMVACVFLVQAKSAFAGDRTKLIFKLSDGSLIKVYDKGDRMNAPEFSYDDTGEDPKWSIGARTILLQPAKAPGFMFRLKDQPEIWVNTYFMKKGELCECGSRVTERKGSFSASKTVTTMGLSVMPIAERNRPDVQPHVRPEVRTYRLTYTFDNVNFHLARFIKIERGRRKEPPDPLQQIRDHFGSPPSQNPFLQDPLLQEYRRRQDGLLHPSKKEEPPRSIESVLEWETVLESIQERILN